LVFGCLRSYALLFVLDKEEMTFLEKKQLKEEDITIQKEGEKNDYR
jgi:hypothetical protein